MDTTVLKVRVNPRSSKNEITGWQNDTLRIKISAPPVEGAANKACIQFLSGALGVRKSQITLVSGESARDKVFRIAGMTPEEIRKRLQ